MKPLLCLFVACFCILVVSDAAQEHRDDENFNLLGELSNTQHLASAFAEAVSNEMKPCKEKDTETTLSKDTRAGIKRQLEKRLLDAFELSSVQIQV